MGWLDTAKTFALDILFPKVCLGCRVEGSFLCRSCAATIPAASPGCLVCGKRNLGGITCGACRKAFPVRRFFAPFPYSSPIVRELVHTFKYDGLRELAALFGDAMVRSMATYGLKPRRSMVLVPIPLARSRLRERGFNQAELLARELGARLDLSVIAALRRTRATEQQIQMKSFAERHENICGAFGITDPALVKDRSLILVDDVATSGATLSEAAGVLRQAGAKTVWAIVVAKG